MLSTKNTALIALLCAFLPFSMNAQGTSEIKESFSDLPSEHPAFAAVKYLKTLGILSGYDNGTFQPARSINRAETLKIIVAPITLPEQLMELQRSSYSDISNGEWYFPYVERAYRVLKIIDGPPKTSAFHGERTVTKSEFLKMLFLAHGVDLIQLSEFQDAISHDVTDKNEWYYSYIRFGVGARIIEPNDRFALSPGEDLTRSDVAIMLHRFLLFKGGDQTPELMKGIENELLDTLSNLAKKDIMEAGFSSARANLIARYTERLRPNDAVVKSTHKITESFRDLVNAYDAYQSRNWDNTVSLSVSAWNKAGDALITDKSMRSITSEVQKIAKSLADQARKELQSTKKS